MTRVMKDYADEMCKCTDAACVQKVQTKYQDRLAKLSASEVRPRDRKDLAEAGKQMERAQECFRKAASAAVEAGP